MFLVLVMLFFTGCVQEEKPESTTSSSSSSTTIKTQPYEIRIASWDLSGFDSVKANDTDLMVVLSYILKDYDVIAVQGIHNLHEKSDEGCPINADSCPGHKHCGVIVNALEKHLNVNRNLDYGFVFSPQLLDERYLYIYNKNKVKLLEARLVEDLNETGYLCEPEDAGLMVKQPYMARFQAGDFIFTLLNAHTTPSNNRAELDALEFFFRRVEEKEDNVILLGNLNADCGSLDAEEPIALRDERFIWIIDDDVDTTNTGNHCAFDRIIMTEAKAHYNGVRGRYFKIPQELSTHYLIWAQYSTIAH